MSYISFDGVSKSFGDKNVISNLSFIIESGTSLAIMGPSGSGKTTIINLLLGFEKPASGQISRPERISVVFQEDRLCEDYSSLSNATLGNNGKEKKKLAVELLTALGLSRELKTPVRELSGGMKRRVAIARALASDADFYIFDEPFKGLDEDTRREVIEIVKRYMKNKTFLLITHNALEAEALCDKMLILD